MKERPILMNGAMVRATLREVNPKTQTRRIDKYMLEYPPASKPDVGLLSKSRHGESLLAATWIATNGKFTASFCPYGKPRDRMWVRETTEADYELSDQVVLSRYKADGESVLYSMSEDEEYNGSVAHWDYTRPIRPSIHMPRWASRILLEITNVRVERLQDIGEVDATAEGTPHSLNHPAGRTAVENYQHLWECINGDGSWDANPYVWVIDFRRIKP